MLLAAHKCSCNGQGCQTHLMPQLNCSYFQLLTKRASLLSSSDTRSWDAPMNLSWDGWERATVGLLFPSFPGVSSCTSGHNKHDSGFAAGLPFRSSSTWAWAPALTSPKGFTVLGKDMAFVFHEGWGSLTLPVSAP